MLNFDFTDLLAPRGPISAERFEELGARATAAQLQFSAFADEEGIRFTHLPLLDVSDIEAVAERLRANFDHLVVIGIGGSSLGGRALYQALSTPRGRKTERGGCKLWFLENVDGSDIEDLLDLLPLERTAFNVITKSGTTIETMGSFFVVRERLLAAFGEEGYRARMVATTDPAAGELRKLVDREGLTSLPVPPGVGGRFSVLTAVGLLPLAAAGVDIRALLRGAAAARANALAPSDNVALDFARAHVALVEAGVTDLVFMPYAQVLSDTSLWFVQLWAESLGKQRPDGSRVGPTPIAAVGAVDQHSQLQLFMEGPANKAVCFVDAGPNSGLRVPAFGDACPPLSHLAGRTFDELRQAELRGVRAGLIEAGRGVSTITIPAVTAETMGALIFLLESATAMAGWMLGVEPFDQPGVEAGKRFAHGLLGQASYAQWAERAQAFESGDRKTSGF